jgi:hypothetical protein
MKRDFDLVRKILLAVEKETGSGDDRRWLELELPGYTAKQVNYHVMLLKEAQFIRARSFRLLDETTWRPVRLTWRGHEFLDNARNVKVWNQVMADVRKKGGSVSWSVLRKLLAAEARAAIESE